QPARLVCRRARRERSRRSGPCRPAASPTDADRRRPKLSVETVLLDDAVLDDQRDVTPLPLEQENIAQRIAVDHDDVGDCPFGDDAEFSLAVEDLRVHGGRLADDLVSRQDLGAYGEFARLLLPELPEQVR